MPISLPVAVPLTDMSMSDSESYYGCMLNAAREALAEQGVELAPVHCRYNYQQEDFLRTASGAYLGALFTGDMYSRKDLVRLACDVVTGPKVILDHHFDDLPVHSVREDAVAGMRALTEHLLELGHTRLAYLDMPDLEANPWKRLGVNLALRAAGRLPLARNQIAGCSRLPEDAVSALEWFVKRDDPPTAVICCSDAWALLFLEAAQRLDLRVPEDLSVTGYGHQAELGERRGWMTTCRVDAPEMGRRAAELLLAGADSERQAILVPVEPIVGQSTAPPQKMRELDS